MKSSTSLMSLGLGLGLMLLAPTAPAAGTYSDSLQAADAAMGAQKAEAALQEIDTALTQSANPGERGLALAKKGYVLAFLKQDYATARSAANEALATPGGLAPVAKVTALQVLAQCQIKADKDYAGAFPNLQSALALEGVDWAKPALTMSLADCYRSIGQLEPALTAYRSITEMPGAGADMKAGAFLNVGFIYQYDRKDAAKTKEAYAAAVKLRPDLQKEVDSHLSRLAQP